MPPKVVTVSEGETLLEVKIQTVNRQPAAWVQLEEAAYAFILELPTILPTEVTDSEVRACQGETLTVDKWPAPGVQF